MELLNLFKDNLASLSLASQIQDGWVELINLLVDVGVHISLIGSLFGLMLYVVGIKKCKHSLEVGFIVQLAIKLIGGVLVGF